MGTNSVEEAKKLYYESKQIFHDASMNLRDYISNNSTFNEFLSNEGCEINESSKILGLHWNTSSDTFTFTISKFTATTTTKRTVLQFIASVYDPLGIIAPILITPKLFLQKLWKASLSWDDPLTKDLCNEWNSIINLYNDKPISIPRLIHVSNSAINQLHCFVDASGHTYGAVAYLRTIHADTGETSSALVFAKSRLCPVKGMTIPKLELMALVIGTRILKFIQEQLDFEITESYIWSDSKCALQWLTSYKELSVFIKNRVREITNVPRNTFFRYVSSAENPADIISRGSSPHELVMNKLWWYGPPWLELSESHWPREINIDPHSKVDSNEMVEDELIITTYEVEAIVNSRPLTYYQDDLSFKPLRPIDFILSGNTCIASPPMLTEDDETYQTSQTSRCALLNLWKQSQLVANNFWHIWKNEYLNSLREYSRCDHNNPRSTAKCSPQIDDIVLLRDDNIPRAHWKLARICELPSTKEIRSATIQLANGKRLQRAINFLHPLEIRANSNKPSEAPQDIRSIQPRRSPRIALLPPKTYVYFLSLLLISCITATHNVCRDPLSKLSLIFLQECESSGIGIYKTSNGYFCYLHHECTNNTFLRLNSDYKYMCGFPCGCPKWATRCSHYSGNKIKSSIPLIPEFKKALRDAAPIICSDTLANNNCSNTLTTKTFYQIQMFDLSLHILKNINLKISDTDILDEPVCIGNDTTATGTSQYCQQFPCANKFRKFCYYPLTPITYLVLHKHSIPIRAWGVIERTFFDFDNSPSVATNDCNECSFRCLNNGSILLRNLDTLAPFTLELCFSNSFRSHHCEMIHNPPHIVSIPREIQLTNFVANLTLWKKGLALFNSRKLCPPLSYCNSVDCKLCYSYITHCSKSLERLVLIIILWLFFMVINIIIYMFSATFAIIRFITHFVLMIIHIPYYTIKLLLRCMFLRNSGDTPIRNRKKLRVSQRTLATNKYSLFKAVLTITITLLTAAVIHCCSDISSLKANTAACTYNNLGNIECSYDSSTLLAIVANNQELCLSLLDMRNEIIGSLVLTVQPIKLLCIAKSYFFTRDHTFIYPSIKRCKLMGSCKNNFCATIKTNDNIDEFSDEINNTTGFAYCMESCACFHCGCFLCTPACLFYKIIPEYMSTTIYELFSCSSFSIQITAQIALNINGQESITNTITITLGRTFRWNNIIFNVISTSLPHAPLLRYSFPRKMNNNKVRVNPPTSAGQQFNDIGQLYCRSHEEASNSKYEFNPDVCNCHSNGDAINCNCAYHNYSALFENNEFLLPLSLGPLNLRQHPTNMIEVEVSTLANIQLQVTARNLSISTKSYDNICNTTVSAFSGCYQCNTGAIGNVTCFSNFGTVFGEIECAKQYYTVKCSKEGAEGTLTYIASVTSEAFSLKSIKDTLK
uniref:DUF5641 domain-containing protein n=1 Tax=Heterorhabditis bacteriophora TaxID=37862 RepID=A0A1I7W8B8_HETBA